MSKHEPRGWRISPHLPIALYLGLVGVIGLVTGTGIAPETLSSVLPHWMVLVWTVCIAAGGVAGTVGAFNRRTRIETAGLGLLGWGALMYGVVVAVAGYPYGFTAAAVSAAVVSMCVLRMRDLHLVRQADRSHMLAEKVLPDHRGL